MINAFNNAVTVALNHKSIVKDSQTVSKIKPFIDQYNWKEITLIILLMITDGKKWHYLAVKKLSALLRGVTSNNNREFYCLNCFHSYSTKDKIKKHKDACENHDHCYIEMPKEENKALKYNHGEKSVYYLC